MARGFVESFSGRFRDELLNETLFSTLGEARQQIRSWQDDYNHLRPHSGLGSMTPAEFVAMKGLEMRAAQPQKSTRGFSEWLEERRVSGQHSRTVFDAQAHGMALRVIGSLVTDPQMRRTVGITEAELRALEQDGVLQPRTRLPGARLRWLEADGQALVDELNALAHANPGTAKWETVQKAQANSKVSVGRIIAAIRARQIRVHALPGNTSYHGIKVCRNEFGAIE